MKKEIRTKNFIVEIDTDNDPWNPRDDDNLGNMTCFHRRYAIGDKHDFTPESLAKYVKRPDVVSLVVYGYEHSGITLSQTPFSCSFDSGKLGYIHTTHDAIKKHFGVKELTENLIDCARDKLKDELYDYDYYLNGLHYCVAVHEKKYNADTNEIETDCVHSCCGFSNISDAYHEAIGYVDDDTENAIRSQLNA
jgi:hypothetical protein